MQNDAKVGMWHSRAGLECMGKVAIEGEGKHLRGCHTQGQLQWQVCESGVFDNTNLACHTKERWSMYTPSYRLAMC